MQTLVVLVMIGVLAVSSLLQAQEPLSPQALFDAGRHEEAANAIAAQPVQPPEAIFLAGRSYVSLNRGDDARAQFSRLGPGTKPPNPWSLVGESAIALLDANPGLAVEKANQAVGLSPDQFHTNYQLGLAQSAAEQWEPAAAAFEKATTLNPSSAYAHYYAGLAYSRLRQLDRMGTHLEYFLKLAPNAPERPAVIALMQSMRGR